MTITGLLALKLLNAADRDPATVWKEAAARVAANSSRAMDYTCVQTVERHYYRAVAARPQSCPPVSREFRDPRQSAALQLFSTDRLRLDVTLVQAGELYSWVGASRFEDEGIVSVVNQGPIGSGSFGAFLNLIFWRDAKQFNFEGQKLVDGRDVMEFSFGVAREDSHYRLKTTRSWDYIGYYGKVFVDPANGEVVRLFVETVNPDAAGGICPTSSLMDFSMVQIGATRLLLPIHARQLFAYGDGEEIENTTNFANCREYRGESTIRFDAPAESSPDVVKKTVRSPVASGLPFTLTLLDPINSESAAAGDLFRAKLGGTLRDRNQRMVARSGSIVEGRLRTVQINPRPPVVYLVLAPTAVLVGNERVALAANRDWKVSRKEAEFYVPHPGVGPAGWFVIKGNNAVMPRGFRSNWRTAE